MLHEASLAPTRNPPPPIPTHHFPRRTPLTFRRRVSHYPPHPDSPPCSSAFQGRTIHPSLLSGSFI